MSRFVVPKRPGLAAGSTEPPDGFRGRLVKYVPAEILAIYTSVAGGVISSKPDAHIAPWIALGLIVVFLLGTFAYFWFKAPPGVVRNAQLIASPVAFLALAYPIAAPLLGSCFIGWVAIVGQGIAALLAWIIAPEEKSAAGAPAAVPVAPLQAPAAPPTAPPKG